MKRIVRNWVQFLRTDRSLSALLIMLVIVTLVLPPLSPGDTHRTLLGDLVFTLLLGSGMMVVWSEGHLVARLVSLVAIASIAMHWLTRLAPGNELAGWNAGADLIVLAMFAIGVLAKVIRGGTITHHRIEGAVAVYFLFGLGWSIAYEWVELVHPGAFNGIGNTGSSWIYYSFVTLTTMGYGDITPVHPVARSLAAAEALTGQLYIAIMISRLVALELASRQKN
jgi:uncharacterized membrane protein